MKNDNTFAQTNAFAMQHGLWLGLMGIAAWAMWLWSFSMPAASLLFWLLMLGSWAGVVWLTWKFRKQMLTERPTFSFGRGFAHAFLTSTYAALWVAVAVFVYLAFFDHGYVFDQYEQFLKSPDMQQALQQSGMQARLDAMTEGKGKHAATAAAAISQSYEEDTWDEFVLPTVIDEGGTVSDGDAVIMYNFRPDRAREITRAFVDPAFDGFQRTTVVKDLTYVCMSQYDAAMPGVLVAYPPENYKNTLGEYAASQGLTQLRIAETE